MCSKLIFAIVLVTFVEVQGQFKPIFPTIPTVPTQKTTQAPTTTTTTVRTTTRSADFPGLQLEDVLNEDTLIAWANAKTFGPKCGDGVRCRYSETCQATVVEDKNKNTKTTTYKCVPKSSTTTTATTTTASSASTSNASTSSAGPSSTQAPTS